MCPAARMCHVRGAISLVVYFALLIMTSHAAFAADMNELPDPGGITEVTALGPSWNTFTNLDGTGLYHETLRKVFGLYGITVQRKYVPSERGLQMLTSGEGDFQTCYDVIDPTYMLGRIPMYENAFHVFFNKQRIGPWHGPETLRGHTVVGRIGYYSERNFEVPVILHQVKTGVSALGMVLLGRMDFYVDDQLFIEDTISQSEMAFNRDEYDIQEIGRRAYFPVFANNEHGRKVRELYEAGMIRLHETRELEPIFQKWGHPYPQYDTYIRALQ